MLNPRLSRCLWPLLAGALLVLTGCGGGGKHVPVKGKIVLPPNLSLVETDSISVAFQPEESKVKPAGGEVNPKDGTFVVYTAGSKTGVVPGKYKVFVEIKPYKGMAETPAREAAFDPLNKAYDPAASKLTYEVTPGANNITIDLDKGSINKN
jgi:hypothetical protein